MGSVGFAATYLGSVGFAATYLGSVGFARAYLGSVWFATTESLVVNLPGRQPATPGVRCVPGPITLLLLFQRDTQLIMFYI